MITIKKGCKINTACSHLSIYSAVDTIYDNDELIMAAAISRRFRKRCILKEIKISRFKKNGPELYYAKKRYRYITKFLSLYELCVTYCRRVSADRYSETCCQQRFYGLKILETLPELHFSRLFVC